MYSVHWSSTTTMIKGASRLSISIADEIAALSSTLWLSALKSFSEGRDSVVENDWFGARSIRDVSNVVVREGCVIFGLIERSIFSVEDHYGWNARSSLTNLFFDQLHLKVSQPYKLSLV